MINYYFDKDYAEHEPAPPWNPTSAQFAQYLAREHEMAKANIAMGRLKYPSQTLHSDRTFYAAFAAIERTK